jgi:GT2 family glycosyltransferase
VSRPEVSVVMPFAGDRKAALDASANLAAIDTTAGDQLILADNSGSAVQENRIELVAATAERSPAHARNAGAEHAGGEWILFLDSDCRAPRGLLEAYFAEPVADDVGALAGEVVPAPGPDTLVARFGASRGFLGQAAHLAHPFRPRAVAANLMVRRIAFEQVGGFFEGLRAAEDTDFSWRLQEAGWRIELRPEAWVEHRYRTSLGDLRRQWRGYAAGRAWLARRHLGFEPTSALRRAVDRAGRVGRRRSAGRPSASPGGQAPPTSKLERGKHLMLETLLGFEELAGLSLSNRPEASPSSPASVVLVADRFPVPGDPLLDLARAVEGARIEAVARPTAFAPDLARGLRIDYREDDGAARRAGAVLALVARHPMRCMLDRLRRAPGEPPLREIAPAVRRLAREHSTRVHPLGGEAARSAARRLVTLAGRPLAQAPSPSLVERALGGRR